MEPAMPLFEWNDTFSVNSVVFDNHHQKLIKIINKLNTAMLQGQARQEISAVLVELSNYTRFHFSAEEKEMQACAYPGLSNQKAQHRMFEAKLTQYQAELKSGQLMVSTQVVNFLKDWLVTHIQTEDKKYAPYLKTAR